MSRRADGRPGQPTKAIAEALGGTHDVRFFRAPGRVNLMGDHTDYHDGFVLPVAIDRECVVTAAPRDDGRVVVQSTGFDGSVDVAADGSTNPAAVEPAWGRLAAGVVTALASRERTPVGTTLEIDSAVPPGSGLSSSAALEVAVALALCDAAGLALTPTELALACQEAEHAATGVPSGIMDQMASLGGVADRALLIDCRDMTVLQVPLPQDLAILVVHSGVTRTLADTPYAERRRAAEEAAAAHGLGSLRDADPEHPPDDPVARHVVTENARVVATALALAAGDLDTVAANFAASQASLRDDFGCSTAEVDKLVATLLDAGALGARITGAGWGGCVVALVLPGDLDDVVDAVSGRDHWVCRAVHGAGAVPA